MVVHRRLKTLPILVFAGAVGCATSESVELALPHPPLVPPSGVAGSSAPPEDPMLGEPPLIDDPIISCAPRASFTGAMPPALWEPLGGSATPAPPPIGGAAMLVTADGTTLIAADPDRDQLYFVGVHDMSHLHTRALNAGDEPGRLAEDSAGRIHVVLRQAGAIATLAQAADSVITRRAVCAVPRGIAYDAARDQLHVACAEGKLVTLSAAPDALTPVRTIELGADLRDVFVRGEQLLVSRFRSAELLMLNSDGALQATYRPASFEFDETVVVEERLDACGAISRSSKSVHVESVPNVAWRMIDVPGRGVSMLHQRSRNSEIAVSAGGYGTGGCEGIVQTALSVGLDTPQALTADIIDLTLAVDFVIDEQAALAVVIAPGNFGGPSQLQLVPLSWLDPLSAVMPEFPVDRRSADGRQDAPCLAAEPLQNPDGQAVALALVSAYEVAVLQREPAAISFYDLRTRSQSGRVDLLQPSRFDTGHAIFHARTSAGLACASCHPEAGDDARVWTFAGVGARRTQSVRGGLLGSEPLHWDGDMADISALVSEVFVKRMSGFTPTPEQSDALAGWLDAQPALHAQPEDAAAAARGKALFESAELRCAQCHAGEPLTNNQTEDVGTGAALQVPSLKGVRFRTPLMHDGCASTLRERFTNVACGGGDMHGTTSHLTDDQVTELVAYLETL